MISEQYRPVLLRLPAAAHHPLASVFQPGAMCRPSIGISASVNRIGQYTVDTRVDRQLPYYMPAFCPVGSARQGDALSSQPTVDLADALQLSA